MDACKDGTLDATVALVVSNNSASGALKRAQQAGLAITHISGKTHADGEGEALLAALEEAGTDWVLLLGYMKKLGDKPYLPSMATSSIHIRHYCQNSAKATLDAKFMKRCLKPAKKKPAQRFIW